MYLPLPPLKNGARIVDTIGVGSEDPMLTQPTLQAIQEATTLVVLTDKNLGDQKCVAALIRESNFYQRMIDDPQEYNLICLHNIEKSGVSTDGAATKPKSVTKEMMMHEYAFVKNFECSMFTATRRKISEEL